MIERIHAICREEEYKFKLGSTAGSVLDTLARMHPPRGDVVDDSIINAVMRLQFKKAKELVICGTAVLCTSTGICLTADHCLNGFPRRPKLFIGGHAATICARDAKKGIAALKICNDIGLRFIKFDETCPIEKMMKVHLVGYGEYTNFEPTITHGRVVNSWTPNVVGADYASFPTSSGGAVVHKNRLIGIHLKSLWQEDGQLKEEAGFLNAAAICNFLNDQSSCDAHIRYLIVSLFFCPTGKWSRMVTTQQ